MRDKATRTLMDRMVDDIDAERAALRADLAALRAENAKLREALQGPHGDRLNLIQNVLRAAENNLDADDAADGDRDAWAMHIAEAVAFINDARAALAEPRRCRL